MESSKLYTVRQFAERHRAFPEGGLRWQIFNEDKNGLRKSGAIIRVGRKVLINEERFLKWIYENPSIDNCRD